MSRWLKSVNNLLETLDGTAENVAEEATGLLTDDRIGQLLENGRQAAGVAVGLPQRARKSRASSGGGDNDTDDSSYDEEEYEEELYSEDEDEDEDDDIIDEDEEVVQEEVILQEELELVSQDDDDDDDDDLASEDGDVNTDGNANGEFFTTLKGSSLDDDEEDADAVSIGIRHTRNSVDGTDMDTVSDISFSEYTEEEILDDELYEEEEVVVMMVMESTSSSPIILDIDKAPITPINTFPLTEENVNGMDAPPKTPNRHDSTPKDVAELAEQALIVIPTTETETDNEEDTMLRLRLNTINKEINNRRLLNKHSAHSAKASPRPGSTGTRASPRASPSIDQSPRPPRRSVDGLKKAVPPASAGLLESDDDYETGSQDKDNNNNLGDNTKNTNSTSGNNKQPSNHQNQNRSGTTDSVDDTTPPRLPTRQSSFPLGKGKKKGETSNNKEESKPPDPSPSSMPALPPKSAVGNPKESKEYQKLYAKVQSFQSQLQKSTNELKTSRTEVKKMKKQVTTLDTKLETADSEINAQSEELRRAGERLEKERKRAEEEREDLLDDHDDEIEQLRESHETQVTDLRTQYEQQIADLKDQLGLEEMRRRQEGGDWTQDLQDAVERERDALKKLNEVQTEKSTLASIVSKLESERTTLQSKLESSLQTAKTAQDRERQVEDKLDASLSAHARQLSQRQSREAELERTVFDLGSALTAAQQKRQQVPVPKSIAETENFKENFESVAEELETLKVQHDMEIQRREALQQELAEISKERSEEAAAAQTRYLQHERKVTDLESTVTRLQTSLREPTASADGHRSIKELEASKLEIAKLSDQLMRHQGHAENSKSEILALKGRLQAASTRAEEAEKSLAQSSAAPLSTTRMYDMEGGSSGMRRRRIKGGARSSAVRSIRSSLNLGPGRTSPALHQVAITIDALDKWMVDTGSFMRHEPMARLGFLLYLMTLHVWSFALVVFHTTEVPHADFGSMDNNPRHWREHA